MLNDEIISKICRKLFGLHFVVNSTIVFPCIALTPFERLFVYFLLITVYRTDSVDLSLRVGLLLSCFCCPFSRVIGLRTDFVDHTL